MSEERIKETWERFDCVWMGKQPDRTPFKYSIDTGWEKELDWNEDFLFSPARLLDFQLRRINQHCQKGLVDDFIPIVYPSYGTGALATSFGSKPFYRRGSPPAYWPAIQSAEQAQALEKPDLLEDGWFPRILKNTERLDKKIPSGYHLGLYDIQGPLDMAWVIWEPINLVRSMYTDKATVHDFMRMCTELLIESIRMEWEVISNRVPFGGVDIYLPLGRGLVISDDVLANLSPQLYKEFGVPYNSRLSEEFGGLVIHSCGNFEHNLENLRSIPDLRGVDYGVTETNTSAMLRLVDKMALHIHGGLYWDQQYVSNRDLVIREKRRLPRNARVIFALVQHVSEQEPAKATAEVLDSLTS